MSRAQELGKIAASVINDHSLTGPELLSIASFLMEHALRQAGSPQHMLNETMQAIADRLRQPIT